MLVLEPTEEETEAYKHYRGCLHIMWSFDEGSEQHDTMEKATNAAYKVFSELCKGRSVHPVRVADVIHSRIKAGE